MTAQTKTFRAIDVGDGSDGVWRTHLEELLPTVRPLLTDEGRTAAGAERARSSFAEHLPELVPLLKRLVKGTDDRDAETLLTMTAVRPFFSGCTQIGERHRLLRNYDFPPDQCEGTIVHSDVLRPIIGTQEGGWGLLDGMNDAGLGVSLTFGGRHVVGPGFGIPIVLRYLLETCTTVDQAVDRLRSIPIMIPQNVTLVDADHAVTVYVGPDIELTKARDACAANHQHLPVSAEQEQETRTQERLSTIREARADVAAMLRPPLYESGHADGHGTLYTADYLPGEGRVTYHWPDEAWEQSFDEFTVGTRTIVYGG